MAKKPEDTQKRTTSDNAPAVDDVRTKQEMEAAEAKRKADAKLVATHPQETGASRSTKSHPKVHKSQEEGPVQDMPDEPVVEDEP